MLRRARCLLPLALPLALALALALPEQGLAAPGHRASVTQGIACSACHTPESWKSVVASSGGSGFDHSRTGFPLTQRHRQVPCAGCHSSDRRITRECAGCHQDAHQGQLGAACDGCHSAATWFQTQAFERHRRTRLPLTGMHALTECRDCHARTLDQSWSSVPADCYACHADDYRRPDLHPLHVGVPGDPEQPPFPRECATCHRATGWLPVFVDARLATSGFALSAASDHDAAFPLSRGPHRGADCRSCHPSAATPRAVRCDGCHAHDERKLLEQHRAVSGYGTACLTCHPGGSVR
jgi:hypothetical protein